MSWPHCPPAALSACGPGGPVLRLSLRLCCVCSSLWAYQLSATRRCAATAVRRRPPPGQCGRSQSDWPRAGEGGHRRRANIGENREMGCSGKLDFRENREIPFPGKSDFRAPDGPPRGPRREFMKNHEKTTWARGRYPAACQVVVIKYYRARLRRGPVGTGGTPAGRDQVDRPH